LYNITPQEAFRKSGRNKKIDKGKWKINGEIKIVVSNTGIYIC